MKYRKKPIIIDAIRMHPAITVQELHEFAGSDTPPFSYRGGSIFIQTLNGEMKVAWGEWIIKGVKGEFYPCDNDIFEATYEKVDE